MMGSVFERRGCFSYGGDSCGTRLWKGARARDFYGSADRWSGSFEAMPDRGAVRNCDVTGTLKMAEGHSVPAYEDGQTSSIWSSISGDGHSNRWSTLGVLERSNSC